jgi:transcriptional regulator with GAF, ATPase, and Fis domain
MYHVAAPRFTADGEFLGYIGSAIDYTDRKEAEESLQIALAEINELKNELHAENIYLKEMIKLEHSFAEIIGESDPLKYVLFKVEQVAPTDTTVLISGETGTGKELVARAIHQMSRRKDRPLVKVNCAALSATLIESELFGHERGAFTGADARKIGRFELADGATVFLDEIGELPLELQPKLLRLIQEGEFERLGSSKTLKADVRIIAATNRNLEAEALAGRFREDLLFRLNVFPITVPPLRERKEDIPMLVQHFVTHFSRKLGKNINSVSPATMRALSAYDWPGNIRELSNVIERAVIGTSGRNLHVREKLGGGHPIADPNEVTESLESIERSHITKTLINTGWRIDGPKGAARILGVNPSTLRTRMNKLGIGKTTSQVM